MLAFPESKALGLILMWRDGRNEPYVHGDAYSRLVIRVSDVDAAVDELKIRGVPITIGPTDAQMVRYAIPGFTNNWLVLIKTTALVSLIGLHEMTYLAKQASSATREPFTFFLFAAALFLVYTSVSLWALRWVDLTVRRGECTVM